jgi:DNA-binding transcriptional LysR family regulator
MLVTHGTDTDPVVHRGLVLTAFVCCALVSLSFVMFARDQLAGASKHQQSQLAAGTPTTPGTVASSDHHGQPRRFIDGAAHALTSPFRSLFSTNSAWALNIFATVCALILYGVGLGYLARFARGLP